jgi:DNA-binding response OmpR family regulator
MRAERTGAMAGRVLVIDDEANIVLSLVFVLEHEGYDVRSATTGRDGLAEMQRARPDVVILDVMLPDIDGYEVCRQARSQPRLADVPILLLTARAQQAEQATGLAAGATEYVTKPFRVSELIERVARLASPGSRISASS